MTLPLVIEYTMLYNAFVITVYICYHPPAGSDYVIAVTSVTIPANNLETCFSVEIVDDPMYEPDDEKFLVELVYSGAENVTVGPRSIFDVTILGQCVQIE